MKGIGHHNAVERGNLPLLLAAPVIYGMIIPIAFLHISLEIYQALCFSAYGLKRIDSMKYIRDRRWKLQYLSGNDKINCWYCGYANGVVAYAKDVARATEKFWCPIQNKIEKGEIVLPHHEEYAGYGDKGELIQYLQERSVAKKELKVEKQRVKHDDHE